MTTTMQSHDLAHLESRLRDLDRGMRGMSDDDGLRELIAIIHQPGWTTPAEFAMVMGIVESLHAHTTAIAGLKKALVAAGRQVGNG
jgi:hypothetical protein